MVAAGEAPDEEARSAVEEEVGAISGGADRGMAVGENSELLLLSRLPPIPMRPPCGVDMLLW